MIALPLSKLRCIYACIVVNGVVYVLSMTGCFKKGQPSPLKGLNKFTHPGIARAAAKKMGIKRPDVTGSKNRNWKGGTTSEAQKIRSSTAYKDWRNAVFQRDGFTCQLCFEVGGKLEAHHIKPFATHPDLRLDINNGVTYCCFCHRDKGEKPKRTTRFSEEHRKKLSEAAKRRFSDPAAREYLRDSGLRQVERLKALGAAKKGGSSWNKGKTKIDTPSLARTGEKNKERMLGKTGALSNVWKRWHPD